MHNDVVKPSTCFPDNSLEEVEVSVYDSFLVDTVDIEEV
jgi:hypothetical protein